MSNIKDSRRVLSSLESVQIAWGKVLRDFRQWCKPDSQSMYEWKTAPLRHSIMACRTSMVDDAEAMLKAWQANQNNPDKTSSAYMPAMTTAISLIETPPDNSQALGFSAWIDVEIGGRVVQLRTVPAAFRCQIAYFSPDSHGANAVSNQFCNYFKNEAKRTFPVWFNIGFLNDQRLMDDWQFRVLDNSLSPGNAGLELKNLTALTVDCVITGVIPEVIGLGGEWDSITDKGENPDTLPAGIPPIKGGSKLPDDLNAVVTEADNYDLDTDRNIRTTADKVTREITESDLPKLNN